jgi:2-polyprenyl-3-methyl-5-hydroxy-6-metoxy-1,4-benzoquinol methylase
MSEPEDPERVLLAAWHEQATPWARAVRSGAIDSRNRVTDAAIVDAVLALQPGHVLDIGCGEGWLARALTRRGIAVTGVDAVPALVRLARAAGGGEFREATYEEIARACRDLRPDIIVCNFSLLGAVSTEAVLAAAPGLLGPAGHLVVQTLHPKTAGIERDGWRPGSWAGCGPGFGAAPPWFGRTRTGWALLLARQGLDLVEERMPPDPQTGLPASLVLLARPRRCAPRGLGATRRTLYPRCLEEIEMTATETRSPRIESVAWGRMEVEGLGTGKDFKLWPGGGRAWDWNETGTRHVPGIQPADVEELLDHGATTVVLSRGMWRALRTQPVTLEALERRGVAAHVLETGEAARVYNELADDGEPVGGLFHSTC